MGVRSIMLFFFLIPEGKPILATGQDCKDLNNVNRIGGVGYRASPCSLAGVGRPTDSSAFISL